MFAKHRQILLTGIFFLDAALLYASWAAAFWLRFYLLPLQAPRGIPRISTYHAYGVIGVVLALRELRSHRLDR
jgi:hypothetical protein